MRRLLRLIIISLAVFGLSFSKLASAGSFPSEDVRIVVPFPPGGGADTLARMLSEGLSKNYSVSFIVENRPGASGAIGANFVSRAKPDGYTLLMAATGAIVPKPGEDPANFDVMDYLDPVALVAAPPYVLVVNKKIDADSVSELIELYNKEGQELSFASSGIGAASHLAGLQFEEKSGIPLLHIPYKGMGQAVTDLVGGRVDMMFAPAPAVVPYIESGDLKALGVTSSDRSALFPEYPTIAESGVGSYDAVGWFGLFAPPGTPDEIITELNEAVNSLLNTDSMKNQLANVGASPSEMGVEEFRKFIIKDTEDLIRFIDFSGLQ